MELGLRMSAAAGREDQGGVAELGCAWHGR